MTSYCNSEFRLPSACPHCANEKRILENLKSIISTMGNTGIELNYQPFTCGYCKETYSLDQYNPNKMDCDTEEESDYGTESCGEEEDEEVEVCDEEEDEEVEVCDEEENEEVEVCDEEEDEEVEVCDEEENEKVEVCDEEENEEVEVCDEEENEKVEVRDEEDYELVEDEDKAEMDIEESVEETLSDLTSEAAYDSCTESVVSTASTQTSVRDKYFPNLYKKGDVVYYKVSSESDELVEAIVRSPHVDDPTEIYYTIYIPSLDKEKQTVEMRLSPCIKEESTPSTASSTAASALSATTEESSDVEHTIEPKIYSDVPALHVHIVNDNTSTLIPSLTPLLYSPEHEGIVSKDLDVRSLKQLILQRYLFQLSNKNETGEKDDSLFQIPRELIVSLGLESELPSAETCKGAVIDPRTYKEHKKKLVYKGKILKDRDTISHLIEKSKKQPKIDKDGNIIMKFLVVG